MEKKRIIAYCAFFTALACIIFLPEYSALNRLREENDHYKKRIELLENRNDGLKEELVKLREDPNYVERKAREKLGIVKKGEVIYRPTETK